MQVTPEVVMSAAAAVVAAAAARLGWRRRERPGVEALVAFNLGVVVWTGGNALQAAATTLDGKMLAVHVQYLGICTIPVAAFAFGAGFAERESLVTRRRLAVVAAPLAGLLVLSWTNGLHGYVRTAERLVTVDGVVRLEREFGPVFWAGWAYSNLLNLTASALVVRAVASSRDLYRRQVAALLIGAVVPWIAQMLFLAGISPVEPEVFLAVTGGAFVYAVSRYRFLDLLPVGRGTVVAALDDGVVVLDERHRVVDLNPAAREVLGETATVGTSVEAAFQAVPGLQEFYRDREGGALDLDRRWFDVRVSALPGDGRTVVVLRDVTPLAERERELERKNERLEEFATLLSHDLRGPLSIATGYVDLERDERDSEHLRRTAEALERMDDIIDGLLALAREDQPLEEVDTVDLSELARTAWGHVETGSAALTVETGRTVEAEPGRLLRALENLFRNAIEHGDADEVTVGDLDGGFYVADDGTGFDADPDEVFEWGFSTADGTGLGLAIVRRIVDAHGWDVHATTAESGGARFEVTGIESRSAPPQSATRPA
ncbi:PAS domain-containing sensor histidine kinase [Halobacteriales archaeon QS_1_68_20]|nr:MAG: PAS domain-containing sensor histidine kinase [Halobacteriales archaeon QS_1_68_20]